MTLKNLIDDINKLIESNNELLSAPVICETEEGQLFLTMRAELTEIGEIKIVIN